MVSLEVFENGFEEFLSGAIEAQASEKYRVAVANYHKALTQFCNYLIFKEKGITETKYDLICLHLKTLGSEIADLCPTILGAHTIYINSYTQERNSEDCERIKDVIKQLAQVSGVAGKIKSNIEKI